MTELFNAIKDDDTDTLRKLIESGADINATDENGFTPLMVAAEGKNPKVINMLIDAGADINAKT